MWHPFAATALVVFALFSWYWQQRRRSIAQLPGPPPGSWLVGNIPSFDRAESACDADFEWTEKYGNALRFKGCFGEDVLYVSDPKALQYILNTSGYNFPKSWEMRLLMRLSSGRGLVTVDGSASMSSSSPCLSFGTVSSGAKHARQRRVMNPSFSHTALKGFLPVFFDFSRKTAAAWKEAIRKHHAEISVLNISSLLANTTLDIIGEVAFGYKFNAIGAAEPKTELHKAYQNLFAESVYMRPDFNIAFTRLLSYAPIWLWDLLTSLPLKEFQRFNSYMSIARDVAKDLVAKEKNAHAGSKEGGKNLMSILIKANDAEDPTRRLEEEEILPQITSLMLAGHESTASTLGWAFYELSKHPEVQHRLRDEVQAIRSEVASRGDTEITIHDLDSMEYMIAVLKETLRYHPIAMQLGRRALHDDVIPLETPQQTLSGDTITAVPVRKGQVIQVGLASYNRLKSIWGEDADLWRPERFLEHPTDHKYNLGVTGNLATFSSGLRSCIAWRFALIEMQAVLTELIDTFEFSPAPGVEIKRAASGLMQSMVKGRENEGTQMPLKVSIIQGRMIESGHRLIDA